MAYGRAALWAEAGVPLVVARNYCWEEEAEEVVLVGMR